MGPAIAVYLHEVISKQARGEIRAEFGKVSTALQKGRFGEIRHPFDVGFGEDYPGDLEERFAYGGSKLLGWMPKDTMILNAGCNSNEDHRVLAELAAHFARKFSGLVDLEGSPRTAVQEDDPTVKHEPFEYRLKGGVAGRLFFIPSSNARYSLPPDGEWTLCKTGHFYGDADYVEWLLRDPAFALGK